MLKKCTQVRPPLFLLLLSLSFCCSLLSLSLSLSLSLFLGRSTLPPPPLPSLTSQPKLLGFEIPGKSGYSLRIHPYECCVDPDDKNPQVSRCTCGWDAIFPSNCPCFEPSLMASTPIVWQAKLKTVVGKDNKRVVERFR